MQTINRTFFEAMAAILAKHGAEDAIYKKICWAGDECMLHCMVVVSIARGCSQGPSCWRIRGQT